MAYLHEKHPVLDCFTLRRVRFGTRGLGSLESFAETINAAD